MANLKEIRNRISTVSSTMQITSAMKMVSAAKLKKAQDAITTTRPYAHKLTELVQNLSATLDADSANKFAEQREVKKVLLVAISSNRGLCGAFNSKILKQASSLINEAYADKEAHVLAIGKKANDYFVKTGRVFANKSSLFNDLTFDNVAKVAEMIMDRFAKREYDQVFLVYNQFKNAATQIVQTEQFLPIINRTGESTNNLGYIFEPSKQRIIEQLIPKLLKTELYKAVRDSFASEHAARMTAMHKATDNPTELKDQLKLTYNKARQAAITAEILEIVGGAEALKE